ncbi:DUF6998 domain-containing protein [Methanogenium cariaci]|jgi:uncharacterized protein DUF6998|uniref:DUF6998 domain-containing protein n=1 Tax=Methanogenium cariaci TaxID=2197 RepID=UPI0012F68F09|nr:hypothetical protein [Methanogenium cariaci]
MKEESIEITRNHIDIINSVIENSIQYEDLMDNKRRLGITGEVGEIGACFKYNLRLAKNSQSAGYDAIDSEGKKVQIKTRRIVLGRKSIESKRLSSFSEHKFDYCLLVLLDEKYDIYETWKAESSAIMAVARDHKKCQPSIREFKNEGEKIFDRKTMEIS